MCEGPSSDSIRARAEPQDAEEKARENNLEPQSHRQRRRDDRAANPGFECLRFVQDSGDAPSLEKAIEILDVRILLRRRHPTPCKGRELVLYNPLQERRRNFADFRAQVSRLPRRDISDRKYRLIAYLLPAGIRDRYPFLLRKPAAQLAGSESRTSLPRQRVRRPAPSERQPLQNRPKRARLVHPGP